MKKIIRSKKVLLGVGLAIIIIGAFAFHRLSQDKIVEKDAYTTTREIGKDKYGNTIFKSDISLQPIRFKDQTGDWKDYDTSLTRSSKDGYDYQLSSSDNQAYYKKDLSSNNAISIGKEDKLLTYAVGDLIYTNQNGESQMIAKPNLKASSTKKDNTLTYKNVYGEGIDLQFTNNNTQVIKEVVITDKSSLPKPTIPDAYLQLTIKASLPKDVEMYITNTEDPTAGKVKWDKKTTVSIPEGIEFRDTNAKNDRNYDEKVTPEDTLLYAIPATRATDNSGINELSSIIPHPTTSETMLFSLSQDKTTNLSVMTPYSWLEEAEYPVKIDPTVSFQPQSSADDGYWAEGNSTFANNSTSTYIGAYWDGTLGHLNSFTRFTNITIPNGALISSATLQLVSNVSTGTSTVNARISAIDADNPSAPASYSDAENASRTSAYADWSAIGSWTNGSTYTTPDISSVIQEIISRPGWNSGNAMVIYTEDNGTTTSNGTYRRGQSYDGSAANSPQLTITYALPADPSHPSLYLKFNEGTGQVTNDSTSYGNNGTLGNNSSAASDDPTWEREEQCIQGKCLRFDGSNDFVNVTNDSLNTLASDITLSAWVKPSNLTGGVINKLGASPGSGFSLYLDSGKVGFTNQSQFIESSGTLTSNTWHHIVSTFDGTTTKLYINGVLDTTSTALSSNTTNAIDVSIGRNGNSFDGYEYFNGMIDEVKIYDFAETDDQVKSEYNSRGSLTGTAATVGQPPSTDSEPSILTQNLEGYWNLDEGSGTSATDVSGGGNTGTITGGATYQTGRYGSAVQFDGSNDYISIANPGTFPALNSSFSVSGWVNFASYPPTGQNIIGIRSGASNSLSIGSRGWGIFEAWKHGGTVLASSPIPSINTWNFFAYTFDGTTHSLYLNGVLVNTSTVSSGTGTPTAIDIGREPSYNEYFSGLVDDVRIYSTTLNASQVLYLYSQTAIGYWDFEEGTGTTINDRSTFNHTGTVVGTGTWATGKVGKAMTFDGSSGNYVSVSDTGILDVKNSFTVSAWVNHPSSTMTDGASIICKGDGGGGESFCIDFPGTNVLTPRLYIYNGATPYTVTSSTNISTTEWTHVAAVYNGSSIKMYINGILTGTNSSSIPSSINSNSHLLSIGCRQTSTTTYDRCFNGSIDEVKLYNFAQTQAQITEDLNSTHPIGGSPIGSQVIRYKFEEGGGSTAYNSVVTNQSLTAVVNATTYTPNGRYGRGVLMNGTTSQVYRNNASAIDFNENLSSGFTVSIWANPTSDGENDVGRIFQKGTNTYIRTTNESGGFVDLEASFDLSSTDATISLPGILPLNTWTHITMVHNGGTQIQIYLNGKLQGTSTNGVGSIPADSGTLFIGSGASGTPAFDGVLDEFKLYSTALTHAQIAIDYNYNNALLIGSLGTTSSQQPDNSLARSVFCNPGSTLTNCNPVGYWNLEEASGTYYDSSGTGNNGTLGGTGGFRGNGKIGKGLVLNGNGYVQVADSSSLDITNAISFSAWINTSLSGTSQHIISKSGAYEFRTHTDDTIRIRIGNLSDNFSGSTDTISLNTWYHVAGTYDGSRYAVYINGVLQPNSTEATSGSIGTNTNNLFIGAITAGGANKFQGMIDEPMIFDYALSPEQVAWYYNKGKPVAHYKLDECTGSSAYNSITNTFTGTLNVGASGTTSIGDCTTNATTMRYNGSVGKRNYGLAFDGTDDYVNIPDTSELEPNVISISAWIKPSNVSGTKNIVSKYGDSSFNDSYKLGLSGNKVIFHINTSGWSNLTGNISLTAGNWYHVTGTYDGTNQRIYVNGVLDNSTTTSGSIFNSNASVKIGKPGNLVGGEMFSGQIDEVKIYNYPLTLQQVRSDMHNGAVNWAPAQGAP